MLHDNTLWPSLTYSPLYCSFDVKKTGIHQNTYTGMTLTKESGLHFPNDAKLKNWRLFGKLVFFTWICVGAIFWWPLLALDAFFDEMAGLSILGLPTYTQLHFKLFAVCPPNLNKHTKPTPTISISRYFRTITSTRRPSVMCVLNGEQALPRDNLQWSFIHGVIHRNNKP